MVESQNRNCICGKEMNLLWTIPGEVNVWVCPPDGCGRIFLEGSGVEIEGTWYLPETNEKSLPF
jgi:hypothetical protein